MTKVELDKLLGENLRRFRMESKLTQEELAEKSGISPSFCANVESGKKGVSLLVLTEIASALGVSVDFLISERADENRTKNINALLKKSSEHELKFIEKFIRLYLENSSTNQNN